MSRPPIRFRLRPTILTWTVALLCGVVLTIAAVAYVRTARSVEALMDEHLALSAEATGAQVERLLGAAPPALEELATSIGRGLLPDDPRRFGELMVERMRTEGHLGWLGYADRVERSFTGGHRDRAGVLRYNRSTPDVRGGSPIELVIARDGAVTEIEPENPDPYDPTTRPWFQDALTAPALRWLDPHPFTDGSWGISVTRGVVRDGEVIGVLLADYFLTDLLAYLDAVRIGAEGRVYVVTNTGYVLGTEEGEHPGVQRVLETASRRIEEDGVGYRAAHRPLRTVTGLDWQVVVIVPESQIFDDLWDATRAILIMGVVALGVGLFGAFLLASTISRPIRRFNEELAEIARLEFPEESSPRSLLLEVDEMGIAIDRMTVGLRSFARYVPVDLVRGLLEGGAEAELHAESRDVTAVFTDIADFTTTVEGTPPEQLLGPLSDYLHAMTEVVEAEGGVVLNFLGDGLLILFGAPRATSDHAIAAAAAALRMRSVSRALARRARDDGAPALPTRFGLNSGHALVGNFGSPERFTYNVLGDRVNTASRIEGLNKRYETEILVGEDTAARLGDAFVLRPIDIVRVKGKSIPLRVFELVERRADVPSEQLTTYEDHATAFAHYLARRFETAQGLFESVNAVLGHDDLPSRLLAARCARLRSASLPEAWDGVEPHR